MKYILSIVLFVCILLGLVGCASGNRTEPTGEFVVQNMGTPVPATTNARVYYQIFVGSFSDSNGDGIGDLRGIINRFDYLNDGNDNSGKSLGVEGIWLSPIFLSPSYHKYDTQDYYQIDPKFGTEADLVELIELCHQRNVQIILDLVLNHTSTKHPWFIKFREAHITGDTQNEFYNYYSYAPDQSGTGTYNGLSGTAEFYECNFSHDMPELNFDNPKVQQAMVDVAKYYLNLGVDGFRFDAAKYIYFGDEPKNADFWKWYMEELRTIKSDIYTVAEVWDSDAVTFPYFASTNCFNFSMSQSSGQIARAARGGNVNSLTSYMAQYISQIKKQNPNAMPITFITNHDMDRAAGFLLDATGMAKVAANLSLLMPGSSFIYYGEEIGMLGSRGGSNTDANRRLAMFWGDQDTVKNPIGANYASAHISGSVADQLPNSASLYTHYKKVIAARRANPEIANGTYTPLSISSTSAGGFLSEYQGKTVAVIHNTTDAPVTIDLSKCTNVSFSTIAACLGLNTASLEGTILTLEAQTSVILR